MNEPARTRIAWHQDGLPMSGDMDETEFDTVDERELAELWWEFCKENNLILVTKIED